LNALTFIVALVVFLLSRSFGASILISELLAFIPVLIASSIDIVELVTTKPIFKRWVSNLVRMPGD
jgi:hypothetical protein